jgi:hypothetical protein
MRGGVECPATIVVCPSELCAPPPDVNMDVVEVRDVVDVKDVRLGVWSLAAATAAAWARDVRR